MKTKFYLNGHSVTKKAISNQIGVERLNRYIAEAKEQFADDPLVENDYMIDSRTILTIRFE